MTFAFAVRFRAPILLYRLERQTGSLVPANWLTLDSSVIDGHEKIRESLAIISDTIALISLRSYHILHFDLRTFQASSHRSTQLLYLGLPLSQSGNGRSRDLMGSITQCEGQKERERLKAKEDYNETKLGKQYIS